MFGTQWLTLQNYITQTMQLPINEGNWDDKYGEFSDISLVEDTLKAMKKV